MAREIFEVTKDRFHLQDPCCYILQGTWPKEAKMRAKLDGSEVKAEIQRLEVVRDVFTPKYEAAFSGKVNAVSQACLCLGGKLQKQLAGADLTFEMPVMGDFSVLFQFWDADEEFPAKILLLWDKVSLSYLHFETTFYLQGDLLEAILQKINA